VPVFPTRRRRRVALHFTDLRPPSFCLDSVGQTDLIATTNHNMQGGGEAQKHEEDLPCRHRPAHMPAIETDSPLIVFITVCTKNRRPLLARDDVHRLLRAAWETANLWQVGRYVIMPDHLHLFAAPGMRPLESVRKWTSYWKSYVSRHWPRPTEQPLWQTDIWDTQLRAAESYSAKWAYVQNNPVRAGLVTSADAWSYQGEMNRLPWYR